ncbi:MAG: hypothetical protein KC620_23125 [Myxococcales bacterium]|nr:hypothetical protein [Myxococcales bacterium]
MRLLKRILAVVGVLVLLLVLAGAILVVTLDESMPEVTAGPQADTMAREMLAAVDADAWARTGAVQFVFRGKNRHLWDRERGFARVMWSDVTVLLRTADKTGRVWRGETEVTGPEVDALLDRAHAFYINDAFWLNPVVKAFDPGVERGLVPTASERAVMMRFTTGGRTPGDAYLWYLGADGLPVAWQMWVEILPVGGLRVTWADWQTLATGAKVATRHEVGPFTLKLTEVAGAATLAELVPGPDPFAPLL